MAFVCAHKKDKEKRFTTTIVGEKKILNSL